MFGFDGGERRVELREWTGGGSQLAELELSVSQSVRYTTYNIYASLGFSREVTSVLFSAGDYVREGAPLLRLDARAERLAMSSQIGWPDGASANEANWPSAISSCLGPVTVCISHSDSFRVA